MPNPDVVHTVDDLRSWPPAGVHLAVLGMPVAHSISPAMHNAALAEMTRRDSQFADWRYYKFEVDSRHLREALDAFYRTGFRGLNLTVPHKVEALDCIDDVAEDARAMGAVNTLLRTDRGWKGYNTDGFGLGRALGEAFGVKLAGQTVLLIGAGGAARAAAVYCLEQNCAQLTIVNRSADRLEELGNRLRQLGYGDRLRTYTADQPFDVAPRSVVVQATSLGLKERDSLPFEPARIPADAVVMDMIYNPAQTAFLKALGERGVATANGLAMLVWQGVRALEIWCGAEIPVECMRKAAQKV